MNSATLSIDARCAELAERGMRIATLSERFQPVDAFQDRVALRNLANRIIALRTLEAAQQAQAVRS